MRTCPNCGRDNPAERDFCECGTYLRWEATTIGPTLGAHGAGAPSPAGAAPGPPPPPPAAQPPGSPYGAGGARDGVVLTLRQTQDGAATSAGAPVRVAAGSRVTLSINIRNQSGIVDNYDLTVRGLPDGWWTVSPRTVYLVPFGSAGGSYDQDVELALQPPRTPDAQARDWPFEVVATSRANATQVASARATLAVGAYQQLETELQPQLATGRSAATFALDVTNRANSPVTVEPVARDSENVCRFAFAPPRLTIGPGERAQTTLTITSTQDMWIGRPVDRRFQAGVAVVEGASPPAARDGVFRQRPWLPWWVPLLLVPVIAIVIALLALAPDNTTVPDVTRAESTFEAAKILDRAGLKLAPQNDQRVSEKPAGTILEQSPDAGEEVAKGSEVKLLLAVGDGSAKVPSIIGLTAEEADEKLRDANLSFAPSPPDADAKATIESQRPRAGRNVKQGEVVTGRLTGDRKEPAEKEDEDPSPPPPPPPPPQPPPPPPPPAAGVEISPSSLDFTDATPQTITIQNPGSKTVSLGAVKVVDETDSGQEQDFQIVDGCGDRELAANESCEIEVTFIAPPDAEPGDERDAVLVLEDDGANKTRRIALHGVAP